jgi:hypothetical protein
MSAVKARHTVMVLRIVSNKWTHKVRMAEGECKKGREFFPVVTEGEKSLTPTVLA